MTNLPPSPTIADLIADLDEDLTRSATDQASQALALTNLTRLGPAATQAIIDAIWLGEWGTTQPTSYPAAPHAIAARRAWRADLPAAASLLTHSGYLPHLTPLPPQDQALLEAHPKPEGWSNSEWELASAIYTLTTSLRSGMNAWADAPTAATAAATRWGRRATITAAIHATLDTLPAAQNTIRGRAENARWQNVINGHHTA